MQEDGVSVFCEVRSFFYPQLSPLVVSRTLLLLLPAVFVLFPAGEAQAQNRHDLNLPSYAAPSQPEAQSVQPEGNRRRGAGQRPSGSPPDGSPPFDCEENPNLPQCQAPCENPGSPPFCPPPDEVPVDGGLGLLAAAGASYAAYRLRRRDEEDEPTESGSGGSLP